jgi:uncharacterized DUF497 family protein
MQITFDRSKNNVNQQKHGVALTAAVALEWDEAVIWTDERKDYGETRMCAIAYIDDRLYYVVYVDREESRRIISLRKANTREITRYAKA